MSLQCIWAKRKWNKIPDTLFQQVGSRDFRVLFCKLILCDVHNRHVAIFLFCITVWSMCDRPGTEVWTPECRPFLEPLWKDGTRRFCSYYGAGESHTPSMTLSTQLVSSGFVTRPLLNFSIAHLSVRWEQQYSTSWVWTLNKIVKMFSAPLNSIYEGPEWSSSFHKKNTENKIHKASPFAGLQSTLRQFSIVPMVPTSPEERLSALSPELTSGEWNPPSAPAPLTMYPSHPLFFWSDPRGCCLKDS